VIGPLFRREYLAFARSLGRGGLIRLVVIYLGLFGMYLPSSIESPDLALLPFVLFPLYMAGPVGIDTIAGERERGTLETLLSSPLALKDLLWGKFLFSVTAGSAFLFFSLLVSLGFRAFRGMAVAGPGAVIAVLFTSLSVSAFSAVTGMHVSVRARSSRAAQQWFAALSAVFFVSIGALLKLFADRIFPGLKGVIETALLNGWESRAVSGFAVLLLLATGAMLLWLSGRMRTLWKLNSFR
jgi:ABC-type Na+ efflux pump permease subunit